MYATFLRAAFGTKKRAWAVIVAWVLLVGILGAMSPSIDDVKAAGDDGAPADAASAMAEERLREAFPGRDDVLPAIITISADDEATARGAAAAVTDHFRGAVGERTLAPISASCAEPGSGLRPGADCMPAGVEGTRSEDGLTRSLIVPVVGDPTTAEFRDDVDAMRRAAADAADGATTHLTGPAGIVTDTVKVFASGDRVLLFGTILLVFVILVAVYRSPVMAILPLLAVGVAMRLAESAGALLADAGAITVSSQTASIMTVLLFGVGTDYALVINARYREAMAADREAGRPRDPHAAMVAAMGRTGEVLASSAGTIILAMMALLFTSSPSLQGFGPYLAIGVGSMAVVAATFLPALLLVSGGAVFWPGGEEKALRRVDSPLWGRIAAIVDARPKSVLAGALALLIVLSAGMVGYKESYNFLTGFRVDTDSAAGQQVIAEELGVGEIAPVTLLVEGDGLDSGVLGSAAEALPTALPDTVARASAGVRDVAASGDAGRITVVLAVDPYEPEAMDSLPALEDAARGALADAGAAGATVTATGETATSADIRSGLESDTLLLIPLILGIVGLVLGLLLRSILAPIYLVATLALSFVATVGLTVFIAVTVQGDSGIGNRVTAYILVFLIALGVDYTIFLMSRVRQELAHSGMREALRTSLVRTGGVVSSAGLILAATFAVLMTQPIRELYQFGLAMALGILLDTFVVRPLLVPAIVRLIGDRALWPIEPAKRDRPKEPVESA